MKQSKYHTQITSHMEEFPGLSETSRKKLLAEVLGVSVGTALNHIKIVSETYKPIIPVADVAPRNIDIMQTSEAMQLSDGDLYDEIRNKLISVMRTGEYQKDVITASQTLIKMGGFASIEYQESRRKNKEEKPSMKSIGAAMDAIILKSSPEEVLKIYDAG